MIVAAGKTKGYQKPMSESDGTVSDCSWDPAPVSAGDNVDATPAVHTSAPSDTLDIKQIIHEKADVMIAHSTVSGIHLLFSCHFSHTL